MDTTTPNSTPQAVQQPLTPAGNKGIKKGNKGQAKRDRSGRVAFWVLASIVVLCVAAIAWLIVSGKLVVAWGGDTAGTQTQVASARIVCDEQTVDTYNKAAFYEVRPGSDLPTLDTEGLKKLAGEIQTRNGYQDDPTCQNILFWQAINDNDYAAAGTHLTALQTLHSKHLYPDNNLNNAQALSGYKDALESINPQKSPATVDQGEPR